MSEAATIDVRGLSKRYGARTVVNGLSLQVSRGEIFGFLGPNGSGKLTVIKMLCGLVKPSAGSASICGLDVASQGDKVRRTIGYMSQSFSLYDDLTVYENLEFYGRAYGLPRAKREERIDEMVRFSNLAPYREQLAGTLSGGWKQRLALASALLHEPAVLFLDEPTAGIDPVARRDLWDLLFTLSERGVALFVTTHYMDEAERCSRVGYIWNGDLIALGSRDELRNLPDVTPRGTARFLASGRDVVAMLGAARKLPYIRDATIFGSGLHLLVDVGITESRIAEDLAVPAMLLGRRVLRSTFRRTSRPTSTPAIGPPLRYSSMDRILPSRSPLMPPRLLSAQPSREAGFPSSMCGLASSSTLACRVPTFSCRA